VLTSKPSSASSPLCMPTRTLRPLHRSSSRLSRTCLRQRTILAPYDALSGRAALVSCHAGLGGSLAEGCMAAGAGTWHAATVQVQRVDWIGSLRKSNQRHHIKQAVPHTNAHAVAVGAGCLLLGASCAEVDLREGQDGIHGV
jgi:hypothetical protein